MIVVLTDQAETDLEEIGDWIARDDPRRALTFVAEIRETCERLAESPRAFPVVPQHGNRGIRRRVFRNYLIFYREQPERVDVLRILHGARDYEPILVPD